MLDPDGRSTLRHFETYLFQRLKAHCRLLGDILYLAVLIWTDRRSQVLYRQLTGLLVELLQELRLLRVWIWGDAQIWVLLGGWKCPIRFDWPGRLLIARLPTSLTFAVAAVARSHTIFNTPRVVDPNNSEDHKQQFNNL